MPQKWVLWDLINEIPKGISVNDFALNDLLIDFVSYNIPSYGCFKQNSGENGRHHDVEFN